MRDTYKRIINRSARILTARRLAHSNNKFIFVNTIKTPQSAMKKQRLLAAVLMSVLLSSCNFISLKNVSNDFKWKNKKFKEPVAMAMYYQPEVITKIPKERGLFYKEADSVNIDSNYKIKELLLQKFSKRNIIFTDSSAVTLTIDKLVFEETSETFSVDDNDGNHMTSDYKNFFVFEIYGSLKKDTVVTPLRIKYEHNTEPRESFLIRGMMVTDGLGASTEMMIQNAINMFTYQTYLKIKN